MVINTTPERIISNACNAVGDCYACKTCTTPERIISNVCYATADCHACKPGAILERRISNVCNAVWYCNACKPVAIIERIVSNACYAVGDYGIPATGNQPVCRSYYYRIAIVAAIILTIALINNNICKSGATIERTISNVCYAVWDCYACYSCAIIVFATSYYSIFCE